MAHQQAHSDEEAIDRFREMFGTFESEFERVQRDLKARRRLLERRFDAGRKGFEKRARKVRKELRKNPTLKRFDNLRRDVTRQLEQGAETVLNALQIASKRDVQRIDRKLNTLGRKLKELERTRRTNGQGATSA
jgi:dsDNA-specific endonuclease/ATPase MutS2